ncbi:DinB family protein [bacterium]|nr:DinB family protein [bacterium]
MGHPVDLKLIANQLQATPTVLRSMLSNLPEAVYARNVEEGKWNIQDVVRHLIHADRTNWSVRIAVMLESEGTPAFLPFDKGTPEAGCASFMEEIELFADVRSEQVQRLLALTLSDEDLQRRATHPELGSVTLGQLLATWAVHDMAHLSQILRLLAKQLGDQVGPWNAYLAILRR